MSRGARFPEFVMNSPPAHKPHGKGKQYNYFKLKSNFNYQRPNSAMTGTRYSMAKPMPHIEHIGYPHKRDNLKESVSDVNISLLGFSNVGQRLLRQILENREITKSQCGLRFRIKSIFDDTGYIFHKNGLRTDALVKALQMKEDGIGLASFEKLGRNLTSQLSIRHEITSPRDILIDCSEDAFAVDTLLCQAQKNGFSILTSPDVLTADPSLFHPLAHNSGFAATIGPAPIFHILSDLHQSGDRVHRIFGILSGPLNFVFSQLSSVSFSEAVRAAEEAGIFESQTSKHLQGIDLIQRVLILTRFFGADIQAHDLEIPEILASFQETADLTEFDSVFQNIPEMRPIMDINLSEGSVGISLAEVSEQSVFQSVVGNETCICIVSDRHPENEPLIIRAPGQSTQNIASAGLQDLHRFGKIVALQNQRSENRQPTLV